MRIPLGPYEPDRSIYNGSVTMVANNVIPSADGFAPFQSLTEVSQALGSECRGAWYARTSSGTNRIIATTSTRIYELDTSSYAWVDITGPSGPYNLAVDDYWRCTRYGDYLVIHNINDPIQKYSIEAGGTLANLGGSPPRAKYSWVAGDYLVLGFLSGGASYSRTVQWCAVNDFETWTLGKGGADSQELPEGNEVVGGFGEQGGFSVIQRDGMQFFPFDLGSGFTFTRQVVNPKQGCIAPRSIVSIGPGMFFYLSEDGFFGGMDRRPIGAQRVDDMVIAEAGNNIMQVQGAADPYRKMIWWQYQTVTGAGKRVGYHWQLDRWCQSTENIGEMVPIVTPSLTWDGLDTLYATIDDVSEAFDSRLFYAGRPTMAAFSSANKLGYFEGPNLEATIETGDLELDDTARTFVSEARVQTDATTVTVADGVSAYHGGSVTWSSDIAQHPRTGLVHFRSDGRLHRFRVKVPASSVWSIASSINVKAMQAGEA